MQTTSTEFVFEFYLYFLRQYECTHPIGSNFAVTVDDLSVFNDSKSCIFKCIQFLQSQLTVCHALLQKNDCY